MKKIILIFITCFGLLEYSFGQYGDGSAGALTVNSSIVVNTVAARLLSTNSFAKSMTVDNSVGFVSGDVVLVLQMTGIAAGTFDFQLINSITGATLYLRTLTSKTFSVSDIVQVIKVPQYTNVTINSGGSITANLWNGTFGGVVSFFINGTLSIADGGTINVTGKGYPSTSGNYGGSGGNGGYGGSPGAVGGNGGSYSTLANGMGGGGNGGDYGSYGYWAASITVKSYPGNGFIATNKTDFTTKLLMGSGGYPGFGNSGAYGAGGGGGGANGSLTGDYGQSGERGGDSGGGGNGGIGGGIIYVVANTVNLPSSNTQFYLNGTKGSNGSAGMAGGKGGNGGLGGGDCIIGGGGGGGNGADGGNGGPGGSGGAAGALILNYQTISNLSTNSYSLVGGASGMGGYGGLGGAPGLNAGTKNGALCPVSINGSNFLMPDGSGISPLRLQCDHMAVLNALKNMGSAGNSSGTKSVNGNLTTYDNGTSKVVVETLSAFSSAVVAYIGNPWTSVVATILIDSAGIQSPNLAVNDIFTNSNGATYGTGSKNFLISNTKRFVGQCNNNLRQLPKYGNSAFNGSSGTSGGSGPVNIGVGSISFPLALALGGLEYGISMNNEAYYLDWVYNSNMEEKLNIFVYYSSNGIDFDELSSFELETTKNSRYQGQVPIKYKKGYIKLTYQNEGQEKYAGKVMALNSFNDLKLRFDAASETLHIKGTSEESIEWNVYSINGESIPLPSAPNGDETIIDVSALKSGIYMFKATLVSNTQMLKFFK